MPAPLGVAPLQRPDDEGAEFHSKKQARECMSGFMNHGDGNEDDRDLNEGEISMDDVKMMRPAPTHVQRHSCSHSAELNHQGKRIESLAGSFPADPRRTWACHDFILRVASCKFDNSSKAYKEMSVDEKEEPVRMSVLSVFLYVNSRDQKGDARQQD